MNEYKVISATYELIQSPFPCDRRDLIILQPSRSIRSSTLVTLLQPPLQSQITNRFFGMLYLTCGISFLLVFLVSLVHY